jgi:peptidoglycan/LPS O-acetylase OafA/YrhL
MVWVPIFQYIPLFLSGIVFYKLYHEKQQKIINYLIILFCLICQIFFFSFSGRSGGFINQIQYATMLTIYFTLFTLFVNYKLQFIVNRFTLFMGKISFALYLIHQFVSLKYIIPYFHTELGINFWVVTFLINLPILIIVASLITYKIEVPLSKKMKYKLLEKLNAKCV